MLDDSWSVDGAFQKSIQSLSIRFSGLDIRSTPEYMGQHIRTAMHRVRRLVGNRVPFGPDASFKISLGKKSAKDVRLARALALAAADGNIQEMNASILQGADINGHYKFPEHEGSVHCTPLMAAVCSGNKSAVEFLLENEAAVDGSHDSLTIAPPLCLAAEGGDIELVKCLLLHNAKVNKEAKRDGGHAACFAARNGHTETLSLLIDHGVDVHRLAALDLATDELPGHFTPFRRGNILAIAIHHNHLNTVKMLLNRREIDFEYCDASAALVMAAYHGNLVTIELLLGKHPQLCTFFTLWVAASQGYKILVDVLINHQKQNKSQLPLQTPMILKRAIKRGQADLASLLLSPHSGELCDEDTYDCRSYESKCARDLVGEVCSTSVDIFRFNVAMGLNCAIYYHDVDAARIFLEAGLNPNIRIYPSNVRYLATNLMLASRLGCPDMVKLL
jgi:ankyrin repeat protein